MCNKINRGTHNEGQVLKGDLQYILILGFFFHFPKALSGMLLFFPVKTHCVFFKRAGGPRVVVRALRTHIFLFFSQKTLNKIEKGFFYPQPSFGREKLFKKTLKKNNIFFF